MSRHTLSVLVEDKPGVLARVASLFSRRGFNIESLAVGPTEVPDVSRMTIVVEVEGLALEQVTKQLNKLINVLKIVQLEEEASVQRAIVLIKVKADANIIVLGDKRQASVAGVVKPPRGNADAVNFSAR